MVQRERVFRHERGATHAPLRVNTWPAEFALEFESANLRKNRSAWRGLPLLASAVLLEERPLAIQADRKRATGSTIAVRWEVGMEIPIPENQMRKSKAIRTLARFITALKHGAVIAVLFALPKPWHEIAGHGLVGVLCGGRITRFQLFGWQWFPKVRWTGVSEGLGVCDHTGIVSQWGVHLTDLAGSISVPSTCLANTPMGDPSHNGLVFL